MSFWSHDRIHLHTAPPPPPSLIFVSFVQVAQLTSMLLHADGGSGGGAKDTNAQNRTHEMSPTDQIRWSTRLRTMSTSLIGNWFFVGFRRIVVSILDNEHIVK